MPYWKFSPQIIKLYKKNSVSPKTLNNIEVYIMKYYNKIYKRIYEVKKKSINACVNVLQRNSAYV